MDVPAGLGVRGLGVWEALKSGDVARDALAVEAARSADRLDELDNIIQGKGVLNLMIFRLDMDSSKDGEYNVEVKFQNVLSEARQQQATFANLLEKIDKLSLTARAPKGDKNRTLPAGVTALDKIRARVRQETG
jgi:hypothetical protein